MVLEWSYDYILIRVTWVAPDNRIHQVHNRSTFSVSLVPSKLARIVWQASEEKITDKEADRSLQSFNTPRKAYKDQNDFYDTILGILKESQKIILKSKPVPFWNESEPKSEPDAAISLRLILEGFCSFKNISIFQEDPMRSGRVDMVFQGIMQDYAQISLVLELKNAHSNKLEDGLVKQLPSYIEDRDCGVGVYGVFWYKGEGFSQPRDNTIEDCLHRLRVLQPDEIIEVLFFDVSMSKPASLK